VHPRGGRALGFRPEFVSVQSLSSAADLVAVLLASASVPPFMPVGRVGGAAALDGGLVDNVPVEPLRAVESRGGRTLVILSRLYKAHPEVPGRLYVQPSHPIPIGQFDITNPAGIRAAYAMGLTDGEAFARRMSGAPSDVSVS
jgi:predicted acylesterase/phospholipase RssA